MKNRKCPVWIAGLAIVLAGGATHAEDTPKADPKPIPVKSGTAKLSPDNSRISFIGTHEGETPDPKARHGGFAEFAGKAKVNEGTLESVIINIDTKSVFTQIPKLTKHLKSPDFFNVRSHPKAKFKSTRIEKGDKDGQYIINGEFTLLDTTKEIAVPATIHAGDEGLTLVSKFVLNRSEFGMNYGQGSVVNDVTITVVIGEKSEVKG
ncbi:MAG: YceI family protein [Planctomycetota bacterium]|jgi:polyisoprenoid-binding protein YceI